MPYIVDINVELWTQYDIWKSVRGVFFSKTGGLSHLSEIKNGPMASNRKFFGKEVGTKNIKKYKHKLSIGINKEKVVVIANKRNKSNFHKCEVWNKRTEIRKLNRKSINYKDIASRQKVKFVVGKLNSFDVIFKLLQFRHNPAIPLLNININYPFHFANISYECKTKVWDFVRNCIIRLVWRDPYHNVHVWGPSTLYYNR